MSFKKLVGIWPEAILPLTCAPLKGPRIPGSDRNLYFVLKKRVLDRERSDSEVYYKLYLKSGRPRKFKPFYLAKSEAVFNYKGSEKVFKKNDEALLSNENQPVLSIREAELLQRMEGKTGRKTVEICFFTVHFEVILEPIE